jgi:hypothetical protein
MISFTSLVISNPRIEPTMDNTRRREITEPAFLGIFIFLYMKLTNGSIRLERMKAIMKGMQNTLKRKSK